MKQRSLRARASSRPSDALRLLVRVGVVFILCLAAALALAMPPHAQADTPHVDVTTFVRSVDPAGARALTGAITTAEHDGARLLVVMIDTPGGDLDSMQTIVQAELAATVPIVTYVAPQAAQAASAGSIIALGAPIVAMAPNTRIGAASPVDANGNDLPPTLKSKVEQDLTALLRSTQTDYHRDVASAEAMVTSAAAYTDTEALSRGLINLRAGSLDALLTQLDGYSANYSNGLPFTLSVAGLAVQTLQPTLANAVESFLFDPNTLFILFIVAAICIYLELAHPGAIVPGVVGGIALIVFLVGATGINPNWGGLALMLLAILLLAVDVRAPTHGALTLGGLISLIAGSLIFFDTSGVVGAPGVSPAVVVGVAAGVGLIALIVLRYSIAAQLRGVITGKESYVGQMVTVIEPLAPEGRVSLMGENWAARVAPPQPPRGKRGSSPAPEALPVVPVGAHARVRSVEGLTLLVEPVEPVEKP